MDEQNLVTAQENASLAADKVKRVIPNYLLEKEGRLVEWYGRLKGNPRTKLLMLYGFIDEIYKAVSVLTPCKKWCTSCCHIPVSISEVEIEVIERGTGTRRNKNISHPSNYHGRPCPFLLNNACSIYTHRPFVCRRHVVLTKTSHWCNPNLANTAKFPLLKFSEVERVFQAILWEAKAKPMDIRQAFGN